MPLRVTESNISDAERSQNSCALLSNYSSNLNAANRNNDHPTDRYITVHMQGKCAWEQNQNCNRSGREGLIKLITVNRGEFAFYKRSPQALA